MRSHISIPPFILNNAHINSNYTCVLSSIQNTKHCMREKMEKRQKSCYSYEEVEVANTAEAVTHTVVA